ncbi:MAG: hypothetical protein ABR616_03640 [Dermatophilaceae bacterium]
MLEDARRAYAKFLNRTDDPETPATDEVLTYVKGGKLHHIDDQGTVTDLTPPPAGTYATPDDIDTHNDDTTAVHGIADTSNLIVEGDARLADDRDPTAHNHVEADVTDLGVYPDATGAVAGKVVETDGTNGWVLVDTPSGGVTSAKNSVEVDDGSIQLVGDQASPPSSRYYGTDGSGSRGFYELPSGSGGGDVPSPHALGGVHHDPDTLANLNSKVTDATLDDASATRTPTLHDLANHSNMAIGLPQIITQDREVESTLGSQFKADQAISISTDRQNHGGFQGPETIQLLNPSPKGEDKLDLWINEVEEAIYATVLNVSGAVIAGGTLVEVDGSSGPNITARAADPSTSSSVDGIALEDIGHTSTGVIQISGAFIGFNTLEGEGGKTIWLADGGSFSAEKPATGAIIRVGKIGVIDSTYGSIILNLPAFPSLAEEVVYDNTISGLAAQTTQDAVDELAASPGLPDTAGLTIVELTEGNWSGDAPARAEGVNPIAFVGVSSPADTTNGITTPENINTRDRWIKLESL